MTTAWDAFLDALDEPLRDSDDERIVGERLLSVLPGLAPDEREQAEEVLLDMLEVRLRFAPAALALVGGAPSIAALQQMLGETRGQFRLDVAQALVDLGAPQGVAEALNETVREPMLRFSARLQATSLLADQSHPSVDSAMRFLIAEGSLPLRWIAVGWLLRTQAFAASPWIRAWMLSPYPSVRNRGLQRLDESQQGEATPDPAALLDFCAQVDADDTSPALDLATASLKAENRRWAEWALVHWLEAHEDPRYVKALRALESSAAEDVFQELLPWVEEHLAREILAR